MTGTVRAAAVAARRALAFARLAPTTVVLLLLLWSTALVSASVFTGPPEPLRALIAQSTNAAENGHWWAPATSMLWCEDLPGYVLASVLVLTFVAQAERRLGRGVTVVVLVFGQLAGAHLGALLVSAGSAAGMHWPDAVVDGHTLGPSAGVVGVALVLCLRMPGRWPRRGRELLLTALVTMTLCSGAFEDVVLVAGAAAGLLAGLILFGPSLATPAVTASPSEPRTLIAIVVAACALGPTLALVTGDGAGPLAGLWSRTGQVPATSLGGADWGVLGAAITGPVPVLALLTLAEGLRRGRRFALCWTVVLGLVLAAGLGTGGSPVLVPLALVVLLLLFRRRFTVASPKGTYRRLGLVVGLVVPATVVADLLAAPGNSIASAAGTVPAVAFWIVVLLAVLRSFGRTERGGGHGAAAARALLVEHGGSSLGYMTLWPGNHYWFGADGRCAVAYRVTGSVALTLGDPLGPPEKHREAFLGFAEFCHRNGWTTCFYAVTERTRDIATVADWSSVQVAEDAVLPLPGLTFTGRKWQDVRTALNKAARQGVVAEWVRYPEAPESVVEQMAAISAEWVANKGLPEMGFTLGGMAQLADSDVRCLIALDVEGTVHGMVSWLPVYRAGRTVGWTLDLMRRGSDCFPGVMEFLIGSSALRLREEGAEFLSLSCAPLARLARGARPGPAQRMLDLAGRVLEPVYGFRSLLAFKAKFQPVYQPMYMLYQDPVSLPRIGAAIARAYLPGITARQALRLVRSLTATQERTRTSAREPRPGATPVRELRPAPATPRKTERHDTAA